MIKRKICLVGIGKFGKKYFHEILNIKNFQLSCIIKKNLNQLKYKSIPIKKFNSNLKIDNFDIAAIVSPLESHYVNANYFLKKNIPIILEKPATKNLMEIDNLISISKKEKTSVIVHHSDLYNKNFIKLYENRNIIGKIKKIVVSIRTYQKFKSKKLNPFFDWMPHILAMLEKYINLNGNLKCIKNEKNGSNIDIQLLLKTKKSQEVIINFCNFSRKKQRSIKIFGNKGILQYDGYNLKNNFIITKNNKKISRKKNNSIHEIFKIMENSIKNKKYINDLHLSRKILNFTNKIKYLKLF